jgi:hypothetical protein
MADPSKLRQGSSLIAVTGLGLVGYSVTFLYVAYFGPGFELGVETLGGVTRAELAASNPAVLHYIDHFHVGFGAVLGALGISIAALAWYGIRNGYRWAFNTTLGIATIALVANFAIHYDAGFNYDFMIHIAPSLLITVLVVVGLGRAYQGL